MAFNGGEEEKPFVLLYYHWDSSSNPLQNFSNSIYTCKVACFVRFAYLSFSFPKMRIYFDV